MTTHGDIEKNGADGFSLDSSAAATFNLSGDQPLGTQVYDYLRELLRTDALKPGATIQSGTLARHLGVSKTPLRDALIQLQTEGFLKILPQRGVVINTLNTRELNELIQILAGLESKAMMLAFPRLSANHVTEMQRINERLYGLISNGEETYKQYNKLNIAFHDVFLDACDNNFMVSQIRKYKERMYHFPDRNYGDIWRKKNADEHQQIITFIQDGDDQMAADFLRDIHWSFDLNKQKLRIRR